MQQHVGDRGEPKQFCGQQVNAIRDKQQNTKANVEIFQVNDVSAFAGHGKFRV
ncbi:MAG TPA: hypothetical protein VER14_03525 [Phototrophicaceae bacterium]|nr:hypothetical protein [Phototrophicaceae bacterium]